MFIERVSRGWDGYSQKIIVNLKSLFLEIAPASYLSPIIYLKQIKVIRVAISLNN